MKKFINKILDVPKLIRTIWIMLWVILIILLVFKFCFNLWYPVVVENEAFINVCNYIDNNRIIFICVFLPFYILNFNIGYLTVTAQKKYNNIFMFILFILLSIGIFFIKDINNVVGMILEICLVVILPIILNLKFEKFKNKWLNVLFPITFYVLLNLWQFTMLIVRGTDGLILDELPSLIILILQIDYYIFIILTWIGVSFVGIIGLGWFWSKNITVLKAEREKELAKAKPNMKKINSIDIRIAELEKEGK